MSSDPAILTTGIEINQVSHTSIYLYTVVGVEPTTHPIWVFQALSDRFGYCDIQGVDASRLPKVWSASTYRYSLISKVVGVPVCEKAAYFFLSLLPYIYIIARILEFFKLFFNKPRQVTICISTLGDGCPFRPLGLNMYVSYVFCGGSHTSRHIVSVCRNIYDRPQSA